MGIIISGCSNCYIKPQSILNEVVVNELQNNNKNEDKSTSLKIKKDNLCSITKPDINENPPDISKKKEPTNESNERKSNNNNKSFKEENEKYVLDLNKKNKIIQKNKEEIIEMNRKKKEDLEMDKKEIEIEKENQRKKAEENRKQEVYLEQAKKDLELEKEKERKNLEKQYEDLKKAKQDFELEKENERKKNEENKKKYQDFEKSKKNFELEKEKESKKLEEKKKKYEDLGKENKKYEEELKKERKKNEANMKKFEEVEKINKKYLDELKKERTKNEENKKKYEQEREKQRKNNEENEKIKDDKINDLINKYNTLEVKYKIGLETIEKNSKEKIKLQEKIIEMNMQNKQQIEIVNKNKILYEKNEKEMQKIISKKEEYINELKKKCKQLEDERDRPRIPIPILIGLNNIGATCYMNATLQCLSNTRELTEFFLKFYNKKQNNIMANEYYKLMLNLWNKEKNNSPYSPYSFKEALSKENPLFAGIAANDSKDLINFLLERFHVELNNINTNNENVINYTITQQDQLNEQKMLNLFLKEFKEKFNSPISNLFYGIMETKSQCHGCNIIKFNFQVYSFLEFPLQQVNQFCFNNGKRALFTNNGKNPDVDLYECFEYYGKIDLMSGDNQMYCNICNKLNNAYYSTVVYSTPLNLIINLNRGKGAIYECKVNFPEQLNLFNFVTYKNGYTVYELYSVICHLGPSSMSGHFVAYCKNRIDNKWYLYNDGMVSLCTKIYQYQDGMPYILFYRALKGS